MKTTSKDVRNQGKKGNERKTNIQGNNDIETMVRKKKERFESQPILSNFKMKFIALFL